jgi:hypothetical protein
MFSLSVFVLSFSLSLSPRRSISFVYLVYPQNNKNKDFLYATQNRQNAKTIFFLKFGSTKHFTALTLTDSAVRGLEGKNDHET